MADAAAQQGSEDEVDLEAAAQAAVENSAELSAMPDAAGAEDDDGAGGKKKNKKKKKKKKGGGGGGAAFVDTDAGEDAGANDAAAGSTAAEPAVTKVDQTELAALMKKIQLLESKPPATEEAGPDKEYKFWKTQPVPQWNVADDGGDDTEGPIEVDKPQSEVRQTPLNMPAGFEWDTLDLDNEADLDQVYKLLNENYVEDDDNMFRFDYSRDFLKWALKPPGWKRQWHPCVRGSKNKKILAFISAIPAQMRMNANEQPLVEINFLCVHKKLRSHRLAPVLIQEITRRVNCEGIFQASYTAGVLLPRPIAKCRYWHRSLHPKKLIDIRFSYLPRGRTMASQVKKYRVPAEPLTTGIRPMTMADVPSACAITKQYLARFKIAPVFDEADYAHWMLPRDGVIYTYVVPGPEAGSVTDVVSFYSLPSTIVGDARHKTLNAAYSYYNVATKTPLKELMQDALILAKQNDFDVFNALDLMDNNEMLEQLLFGVGDGYLHYYLYNYRMKDLAAPDVGLVLL